MFIRVVKKQRGKNANSFMQFNLVQSVRINKKVKQKIILYLDPDPLLRDPDNRKLSSICFFKQNDLFDYNAPRQLVKLADALYQKYLVKYGDNADEKVSIPPPFDKGDYQEADVKTDGKATDINWRIKANKVKEDKRKGIYFIRTNYEDTSEEELWKIYNSIRKVESTFRVLKSDLNMRPVHHQ